MELGGEVNIFVLEQAEGMNPPGHREQPEDDIYHKHHDSERTIKHASKPDCYSSSLNASSPPLSSMNARSFIHKKARQDDKTGQNRE